jgi:hypothetical protein
MVPIWVAVWKTSAHHFACLLVGQPSLRRRIKLGTFAALDQRIALRYAITGMHAEHQDLPQPPPQTRRRQPRPRTAGIVQREVVQDRHDGPDHSRISASSVFAQSRVRGSSCI